MPPWERASAVLAGIVSSLPDDCGVEWEAGPDGLSISMIHIPLRHRGIGSHLMASILERADDLGVPVAVEASATGEDKDPSLYHLVRWYRRFGFVATDLTPEGWVRMHRTPRPARGMEGILRDYEGCKRHADLGEEAFASSLETLDRASAPPMP